MKPSINQMQSYQAAFDYFNVELFEGELPQVILNFSRTGAKAVAFYAPKRWENSKQDSNILDEISLTPKWLNRPLETIFSSLVHEMAHLWQFEFGSPSRTNYHNKEWAFKMNEIGLKPNNGKGGETGQSVSHNIVINGPFQEAFKKMPEEYLLPWRVFCESDMEKKKTKKSGSRVKYTCPECDTNVWGKDGLEIICKECEVNFIVM